MGSSLTSMADLVRAARLAGLLVEPPAEPPPQRELTLEELRALLRGTIVVDYEGDEWIRHRIQPDASDAWILRNSDEKRTLSDSNRRDTQFIFDQYAPLRHKRGPGYGE